MRLAFLAFAVTLSGCVTWAQPATWTPAPAHAHIFTASSRAGMSRDITIYDNGQQIMRGKTRTWAHRVTMTATVDGQPAVATCERIKEIPTCVVQVAGAEAARLTFQE